MLTIENPDDIYTWTTNKLWNAVKTLELADDHEDLILIQEGIDIPVPIWHLTQEWYTLYPTSKKAHILGYGKYELRQFMQELENREKLMRQLIEEHLNQEETTTPRN